MPLGFHKNDLSFEIIDTGNEKTFVFVDCSQYIKMPDSPILEASLPGFCEKAIAEIRFDQVNTLNSYSLNLNKAQRESQLLILPDGVWKLKYKICPYEYIHTKKNYLRITTLNNKLKQVYNSLDLYACDSQTSDYLKHQLIDINILIEGAKAAVNVHPHKAEEYYKSADTLVNSILRKHCSTCKNEF